VERLANGTPIVLQRSPLSRTAHLKIVIPGRWSLPNAETAVDTPAWGVTSVDFDWLPGQLGSTALGAREALAKAKQAPPDMETMPTDAQGLLNRAFRDLLGLRRGAQPAAAAPMLVVVTGDIDPNEALEQIDSALGSLPPASAARPLPLNDTMVMEVEIAAPATLAQEELAYLAQAPDPADPAAAAWQMALYIFTHGYEGRLGKQAISRRGLIYYIDSGYHTDGAHGWITLQAGVDPEKFSAMKELLRTELEKLRRQPPTQREVDEARQHLLGRQLSAAQSNRELAERYAREWLWYGKLQDRDSLQRRLDSVSREQVLDVLPAFVSGSIVAIRNSPSR
jgi:hypothetical protein